MPVLVLLVYSNSFSAGLALDNKGLILEDTRIRAVTTDNIDRILQHTYWWPVGESGLYRPVTTLSYLFNYAVLGNANHAAGYHWINLLLHAGNAMLVWALARRFGAGQLQSVLMAGLWAVHPALTESVTNIVGRADLLAGMALLGGLWLHLRGRESGGAVWVAGLLCATAVGVFSKESAVAIIGVIWLYEWGLSGRPDAGERHKAMVRSTLAVGVPIAAMLWQRWAVLARSGPTEFPFTDNPIVGAGWLGGRLTALHVMARYAGLLVWPARLSCDYSYAQIPLSDSRDWVAWAVAAAMGATVGVFFWFRGRPGTCPTVAALLVFLPTSNLIFPIGTIMAERFLYLPSIAFAAGVVWVLFKVAGRAAPVVLGILICACGMRTFARNFDWHDDLTLSAATIETSPMSFKAHKMRANALVESDPSHGNIDDVIREAEKSLAILDGLPAEKNNADMYRRAGGYYVLKGGADSYRRALGLFERCAGMAKGNGNQADVEAQIARLYLRMNQPQLALDAAMKARGIDPENVDAHRVVAGILLSAGREEEGANALVAGVLMTRDNGLRQDLVELLRGGLDKRGCATTPAGGLNPGCETVHRHLCAGSAEAVRLRMASGRADLAEEVRRTAEQEFGCR
ncbi:MAG TPA: DUF1736 domain-containing protein [Candidatus Acidoferrales bacterium]|nr:DUF1736 domain-containing protein [Candidatus Acidoferrales bacterium]